MTRSHLLLVGAACALACGNSTKIPLGSLDGGAGPSPDRGDAARPPADVSRPPDSGSMSPAPPLVPGPVFPDASPPGLDGPDGPDANVVLPNPPVPPVPIAPGPGPVFPDAGAGVPITGDGGCGATSLCWSLRTAYARAIELGRRCNPVKGDACSVKVVDSLGCSKCETWVNDDSALSGLRQRFQQAGCDRCFFIGREDFGGTPQPAPAGCPDIVCPGTGAPICQVSAGIGPTDPTAGHCDFSTFPTCPAGLMNGGICSGQNQYCFGGAFTACQCAATEPPTWRCF
jgi:hypothetical protein